MINYFDFLGSLGVVVVGSMLKPWMVYPVGMGEIGSK